MPDEYETTIQGVRFTVAKKKHSGEYDHTPFRIVISHDQTGETYETPFKFALRETARIVIGKMVSILRRDSEWFADGILSDKRLFDRSVMLSQCLRIQRDQTFAPGGLIMYPRYATGRARIFDAFTPGFGAEPQDVRKTVKALKAAAKEVEAALRKAKKR